MKNQLEFHLYFHDGHEEVYFGLACRADDRRFTINVSPNVYIYWPKKAMVKIRCIRARNPRTGRWY